MKNKTCMQLKTLSQVIYGVFVSFGFISLGYFAYKAVMDFSSDLIKGGILNIAIGVCLFIGMILVGLVIYILMKSYLLMVENSCRLVNEAKTEEKYHNELKETIMALIEKLETTQVKKEEVKEDLSHIKKSNKSSKVTPELKELQNEAKKAKKESSVIVSNNASPENIKEKLAKAKGEVQKTMAVRSQVAANTITTNMLDDITDKNNIVEFETPEGYSQIEQELFKDCYNLEKVLITDNIKLIGVSAFSGCDGLTTITIGKGVGVIEKNAFEGCTGLDKIIYKGSKKAWDEIVIQAGNEILKRVDITFEE